MPPWGKRSSSNGWATSVLIRIPRRDVWCSTAPSDCAIPGRRCRGAADADRDQHAAGLFVHQHPIVDEACQPVGVKVAPQRGLIVILAHPVEERLPPLRLARVMMEERIQDARARLPDMAEAQGKLLQRLSRGAALEQHEQTGG